jgi:predicted DNA-binding protein (UPF0251 family)
VSSLPNFTYFKSAGIPCRFLSEVQLSVEESEALRLKDIDGLEQTECAVRMGVSDPTFQRILSSARKKVADALLNGKAIRIESGNFALSNIQMSCPKGHSWMMPIEAAGGISYSSCPICGDTNIRNNSFCIRLVKMNGKEETEK